MYIRSKLNQNENFFEHKLIPSLHWVHTKKSTMAAVVSSEKKFQLYYFPLKAKGLGVALIAQFSGLPWDGPASLNYDVRKNWKELKSSGDCVFGQLPYLKTAQGVGINQTTAIVQYISKLAGSTLEGANEEDWIMNQMLIAEAEDLYTALQKYQPTLYVSLGRPDRFKADLEGHRFYWATWVPKQFKMVEALFRGKPHLTTTGFTAGELLLFSYVHQMVLVQPADMLEGFPALSSWYKIVLNDENTQAVLNGKSNFGNLENYFVKVEGEN